MTPLLVIFAVAAGVLGAFFVVAASLSYRHARSRSERAGDLGSYMAGSHPPPEATADLKETKADDKRAKVMHLTIGDLIRDEKLAGAAAQGVRTRVARAAEPMPGAGSDQVTETALAAEAGRVVEAVREAEAAWEAAGAPVAAHELSTYLLDDGWRFIARGGGPVWSGGGPYPTEEAAREAGEQELARRAVEERYQLRLERLLVNPRHGERENLTGWLGVDVGWHEEGR